MSGSGQGSEPFGSTLISTKYLCIPVDLPFFLNSADTDAPDRKVLESLSRPDLRSPLRTLAQFGLCISNHGKSFGGQMISIPAWLNATLRTKANRSLLWWASALKYNNPRGGFASSSRTRNIVSSSIPDCQYVSKSGCFDSTNMCCVRAELISIEKTCLSVWPVLCCCLI